ncbi:MAG: 4Fe-4S dicluster domain-containing protein [Pirellulaceae bacterium]|nr:4Fe-4S dicluster domain-containing protein [Pirellulaceae bacterium]
MLTSTEGVPSTTASGSRDIPDRRQFMRLMSVSMALAGAAGSGCRRWPVEEILPHSARPEGFLPGVPQWYASTVELDGVATGVLVKSFDGRPIKIDGNPDHPLSLGASTTWMQASVLDLYDPERSRFVYERIVKPQRSDSVETIPAAARSQSRTWAQFESVAKPLIARIKAKDGDGLAFLTQPTSSPTVQRLRRELQESLPRSRWFSYQPLHHDHEYAGSQSAFGQVLRPQYRFRQARRIVALDADPLGLHPASLLWGRDWSSGRASLKSDSMNRLYVAEPSFSITGAVADQRLIVPSSRVGLCAGYLAHALGKLNEAPSGLSDEETLWLDDMLNDLRQHIGECLVVTGPGQPSDVQHLVWSINEALQSFGRTIELSAEPLANPKSQVESIRELSNLLQGNSLDTLVILGGNPAFDGPNDARLDLTSNESRRLTTIHLSLYNNETSRQCTWSLPAAHFLEAWGDGRAWDGAYSVQQPLILPLHGGRSEIELLQLFQGVALEGRAAVQQTFQTQVVDGDWETTLRDGVNRQSKYPLLTAPQVKPATWTSQKNPSLWEVQWVADRKIWDGRFANNAWLQELPDPLTKLTWDNAALISKMDADSMGVRNGDMIEIQFVGSNAAQGQPGVKSGQAGLLQIAVMVMPGQARGCLTIPLGYGRTFGGQIGANVGFNAYEFRSTETSYSAAVTSVRPIGKRYDLATSMETELEPSVADFALENRLGKKGRPGLLIRETLLTEYERDHHAVHGSVHAVHSAPLYDLPHRFDTPHKWGMTIDLNACLGCGSCTMACQAENNIPVVGKANVRNNREMNWLRIDRYFKGSVHDPDVVHVPVTCMHCETAPCEQVCPVAATVHDTEGLNVMVYNRCIGTRYCANNCPFKVRRFNYFDYHATNPRQPAKPWLAIPDQQTTSEVPALKQLMFNPDVSVRMRGVMEKCTYCVQRIVDTRIQAKNEYLAGQREREVVLDGEMQTACQQACPTKAIRFGDLNDADSLVSQARADDRHYEMLAELNLKSRTTYLAKIRNR